MASTFYIKRNDRLPILAATLQDANGAPFPLTGTTVKFLMRDQQSTVLINAAATIVNAGAGTVSYAWGPTDTTTAGTFQGEFEVTVTATGFKETFPNQGYISIVIGEDVA